MSLKITRKKRWEVIHNETTISTHNEQKEAYESAANYSAENGGVDVRVAGADFIVGGTTKVAITRNQRWSVVYNNVVVSEHNELKEAYESATNYSNENGGVEVNVVGAGFDVVAEAPEPSSSSSEAPEPSSSSSATPQASSSSSEAPEQAQTKTIAQWNVVPDIGIETGFTAGVMAFHKNGIDRVEISINGGETQTITSTTFNDRTKTDEYFITIDTSSFEQGQQIELTATAYPVSGVERVVDPLTLYVGGLTGKVVEIDTSKSILEGLNEAGEEGTVVLTESGTYQWHPDENIAWSPWWHKNSVPSEGRREVVKAAEGVKAVIVEGPHLFRFETEVHFMDVEFDNAGITKLYGTRGSLFERCRFFDSEGWTAGRESMFRGVYYVIDCLFEDKLYGATGATLARNIVLKNISGDALQGSKMVVNCEIDTIDGSILEHHTDVYQDFSGRDNLIFCNITATNVKKTQAFMVESFIGRDIDQMTGDFDPSYTFANSIFKDVSIITPDEEMHEPPFSHMMGYFNHVIFDNLELPKQPILIRQQFALGGCRDVVFKNCDLHPGTTNQDVDGVEFIVEKESLKEHCSNQIDSRINGMTGTDSEKKIFNPDNTFSDTCWASDIDLTCVARNKPAATLITKRHMISAEHYRAGNTINFTGSDGVTFTRTVVGRSNVGPPNSQDGYQTDIHIVTLDSDVPDTCTPCDLIPANFVEMGYIDGTNTSTYTSGPDKAAVLSLDQEKKALVADLGSITEARTGMISPVDETRKLFHENKIGGDSGNPAFLIVDGKPVLITIWTFGGAGSGPSLYKHMDGINSSIEKADAAAGVSTGYTATEADLSGFTTAE